MSEVQSLTALRGFAALWIVLHHFWPQTDSATPFLISKGYLAVDLFFILSGVVLYLVYAEDVRTGRFSMKQFALKRFARLYPVHIATLLIATGILVIGPKFGFGGRELPYDLGQMGLLHITLLHAWGVTDTGGLNYPSWSLSAEAFAYALFPCLAWLVLKTRHALIVSTAFLLTAIISFQLYWPDHLRNPGDNLIFTRMENDFGILRILPEFLFGLAIAKHTKAGSNASAWCIWGGLLTLIGFRIDHDAFVVFGFAALIGALLIFNPKAPLLAQRIGELSYSIYMVHALVQIIGFKLAERLFGYADGAVPLVFLLPMVGVTMLCAIAMHALCERPARRWIMSLSKSGSSAPKVARSFPM